MARPSANKTPTPSKRQRSITPKFLFFALPLVIPAAFLSSRIQQLLPASLQAFISSTSNSDTAPVYPSQQAGLETCESHKYTTEIVSLDPLVVYINNFTSVREADELVQAGEEDFEDSFISRTTGLQKVSGRTSQSAPLEPNLPLVSCILDRARKFMGNMLQPHEPFSVPQLVRYFPNQRYDLHTDFWPTHQIMNDGSGRLFNRVASFFVFLRDNCTAGETYFPLVDVLDKDAKRKGALEERWEGRMSRGEKDGKAMGVKFKPITGNAVFWVNIPEGARGQGDRRVVHAGLPVGEGEKIGMNIWPRKFYGWNKD